MRRCRGMLWPNDYSVESIELDVFMESGDIFKQLKKFGTVYVFDPVDDVLTKRLLQARREHEADVTIEFLDNPNLYLKNAEVRDYINKKSKHLFADFYQWQRERFNILINKEYKPVGGQWVSMLKIVKSYQRIIVTDLPSFRR